MQTQSAKAKSARLEKLKIQQETEARKRNLSYWLSVQKDNPTLIKQLDHEIAILQERKNRYQQEINEAPHRIRMCRSVIKQNVKQLEVIKLTPKKEKLRKLQNRVLDLVESLKDAKITPEQHTQIINTLKLLEIQNDATKPEAAE